MKKIDSRWFRTEDPKKELKPWAVTDPPGIDREAWGAAIRGVAKSRTRLSD